MGQGVRQLENGAVAAAAVAMAGACAFAAHAVLGPAASIVAGATVLPLVAGLLRRIDRECHPMPRFEPAAFPASDAVVLDELLLTDTVACPDEALLLDDVLVQPSADARVVQLFEVPPRPPHSGPPDASEELRQALLELRRSLTPRS